MKTKSKRAPKVSKKSFRRLEETPASDPEILRRLEELERKVDLQEAELEFLRIYLRMLTATKDLDVVAKPRTSGSDRGQIGPIIRCRAELN